MKRGSVLSRSLAIVALALLLAGALPAPGAAQGVLGGGSGAPQDESLLPDARAPVQVITDPEGDQQLLFGSPTPTDTDFAQTADIVSVSAAENEQFLLVSLKHRGYPEMPATTSEYVLFQEMDCNIEFAVQGDKELRYRIDLTGENLFDGGPYRFRAFMLRVTSEETNGFTSSRVEFGPNVQVALVGGDHIEMAVPKDFIENEDHRALKVGDQLVDWYVGCDRAITFLVSYFDEAGGDEGFTPYTVRVASRSAQLAIAFPEAFQDGPIAVDAGAPTKLSVQVSNLGSRKLLVNVTASIWGPDNKPLPGWSVQAAPTFEVPFNSTLPASVIITPPKDVVHRSGGYLNVRASPVGFGSSVELTKYAFAVVSPSVDNNILFFHNPGNEFQSCTFICLGELSDVELASGRDFFAMNVLDNDPTLGEDDTEDGPLAIFGTDSTTAFLDTPLSEPLRINPEGLFELTMSLRTSSARDVLATVSLQDSEGLSLGFKQQRLSLDTSFGAHKIDFAPNLEALAVPEGRTLWLDVRFNEDSLGLGFTLTGGTYIAPIEWQPSASQLALPLIPVPKKVVNVTDGRALPTLALSNTTDAEEYMNPGQTQAFDLFLVNEGLAKDVIGIKADFSRPGWAAGFFPGNQFELAPGTSAPLCVSITAPNNAKDSEVVHVNLTAWSRADPDVKTSVQLQVIIIESLEIDEETCQKRGEEEYVRPFTASESSTPGFGLVGVLAALGAVALALRRRTM